MFYSDVNKVVLGDEMALGGEMFGVVVCSIDDREYASGFPESKWRSLKEGVLFESEQAGLLHYIKGDQDFTLVARAASDG